MVTLHRRFANGSVCQTGDEQYLLRIVLGSFTQLGCRRPPFTQKSTCPTCGTSPRNPAFVCITWTIVASSLVNRNSAEPYRSTNGLAGSKPTKRVFREYTIVRAPQKGSRVRTDPWFEPIRRPRERHTIDADGLYTV